MMNVLEPPYDMPPIPHGLEMGIEGHLSTVDGLAYLMNAMASGKALTEGDRHLLNLIRHYLSAWERSVADCISRPSQSPRKIFLLLDALREGEELTATELALADTLLTVSRQWGRYLKTLAHSEMNP